MPRAIVSCKNVTGNDRDFCCERRPGCCDSGVGRFRLNGAGKVLFTMTTPEPPEATGTVLADDSPTSNPAVITDWAAKSTSSNGWPSSTPSSQSDSTLSVAARAGIGAGVSLCAIILIAVITCLVVFWLRKRKRARRSQGLEEKKHKKAGTIRCADNTQNGVFVSEVDACPHDSQRRYDHRYELSAGDFANELPPHR